MSCRLWALAAVVVLAGAAVGLNSQMSAGPATVEMSAMKATQKYQTPVEGFYTPLNGKLDLRASEIEFGPGGRVGDHYHFGPGIRRMLAGELTIVDPEKGTEQTVRAGDYFYETGDRVLRAYNRSQQPAQLLVVELVPAGLKGSAMVPVDRRAELAANGARLKKTVCSK